MSFFPDFSRKISCSHAYNILSKKRQFSKKHNALVPIFYQKNVHSLKNTVFSCLFFSILKWKNPRCYVHIWSKNAKIVKNTTYYGPKKPVEKINITLANIIRWADGEKIGGSTLGKTWSTFCDFFRKKVFFFF